MACLPVQNTCVSASLHIHFFNAFLGLDLNLLSSMRDSCIQSSCFKLYGHHTLTSISVYYFNYDLSSYYLFCHLIFVMYWVLTSLLPLSCHKSLWALCHRKHTCTLRGPQSAFNFYYVSYSFLRFTRLQFSMSDSYC